MEKIGIDNPEVLKLIHIRTQLEFAKTCGIDAGTLSDWNKRIEDQNLTAPFWSKTIRGIAANAMASFSVSQVKKPTPAGIKLLNEMGLNPKPVIDENRLRTKIGGRWVTEQEESAGRRAARENFRRMLRLAYDKAETKAEMPPANDKLQKLTNRLNKYREEE